MIEAMLFYGLLLFNQLAMLQRIYLLSHDNKLDPVDSEERGVCSGGIVLLENGNLIAQIGELTKTPCAIWDSVVFRLTGGYVRRNVAIQQRIECLNGNCGFRADKRRDITD